MPPINEQFPSCSHFKECGGCSEFLSIKPPPVWNEVLSFFSFLAPHLPLPPFFHAGSPIRWRHRAKVAVRGSTSFPPLPLVGLFKRSSHDVLPIPECLVHHLRLNEAFGFIQKWIEKNKIVPYEEKRGAGELRYLQGVVQRSTGRVQLSLVFNLRESQLITGRIAHLHALVKDLALEHPSLWHSLWINFNDKLNNVIFGEKWTLVWGEELLWEKFGGVEVCYGPASFGQANLPLFEQMLFRISELIPPQSRLAEFYAGVGVIGLFVASRCEWVKLSEINPSAKKYFERSCEKLSSEASSRLSFISGSTQTSLSILDHATTVIVDPPRKGLDQCLFRALKETPTIHQLLYISCGWEAFKKDCHRLCEEGWVVESVDGYHFFPGSCHVELLVNFKRV